MKKISIVFLTILIAFSSFSTLNAEEKQKVTNLAAGESYELSTPPRASWEDTGNKELTDGVYATQRFDDPKWQGHHTNDAGVKTRTITYDLKEAKSIKRILTNFLHDPDTGIRVPKTVNYRVSNDNVEWTNIANIQPKIDLSFELISREPIYWDASLENTTHSNENIEGVFARYVQIEFLIDSPWVFLDEVEIHGHNGIGQDVLNIDDLVGDDVKAQEMPSIVSLEGMDNYSLNKDYVVKGMSEVGPSLTDGVRGSKSSDENWKVIDESPSAEIMIDMEEEKEVAHVEIGFLRTDKVDHPLSVEILVSNDKENWAKVHEVYSKYQDDAPLNSIQKMFWDGRIDEFTGSDKDINKVNARYVKLIIDSNGPILVDEFSVLGASDKFGDSITLKPDSFDPSLELPDGADYARRNVELKDVNDIVLLYNHVDRDWKEDGIIPYLSYIDKKGKIEDRFFDTVLYLGLRTPEGNTFDSDTASPANVEDWKWYLDRTFAKNGDMDELNKAAETVSKELGDDIKQKVFLMIPYPSSHQKNFGEMNGEALNFNPADVGNEQSLINREKAVEWYLDEAMNEMIAKNYEHLDFVGFYWVAENIESSIPMEEELVINVNKKVHDLDLLNFWIPYFKASGFDKWEEFGFDFAIMQPNFYFEQYSKESRIEEASILARKYGMGVEIEFDESILMNKDDTEIKKQKFLDYLTLGEKYEFNNDVIRAYYQGGTTLSAMANHDNPELRDYYDKLYNFIQHSEDINTDDSTDTDDSTTDTDDTTGGTDDSTTNTDDSNANTDESDDNGDDLITETNDKPKDPEMKPSNPKEESEQKLEVEIDGKLPATGKSNGIIFLSSLSIGIGYALRKRKRK